MDMQQLSAVVEEKLRLLDQQLENLQRAQAEAGPDKQAQFSRDIAALQQVRTKLVKSHTIARKAHDLRHANDDSARARERTLGLIIMIVSGVALLVIVGYLVATAQ